MKNINVRQILNTYKKFSKRQNEILMSLSKTKEEYTFNNLQKELQEDPEAKELLQKIRHIVNREYEKAGICKSETIIATTTNNNNIQEIELLM